MAKYKIENQYRKDIFNKMKMDLVPGRKILDIGCGDGQDLEVFKMYYKLEVYGVDTFKNPPVEKKYKYKMASIYKLPFSKGYFDYVFLHNVLHHIDEPKQRMKMYSLAMKEIKRVTKKNGKIFILEGNRYNPLFYPHMVKMEGHNHFGHQFFKKILKKNFQEYTISYFEAHYYPPRFLPIFKIYEWIMDIFVPPIFRAYNFGVIKNVK